MTGRPMQSADDRLSVRHRESLARNAALKEKALAVIRWQPVQWQAMVRSGGALILAAPARSGIRLLEASH